MYLTDWFATILSLAGQEAALPFNMWRSISEDRKSPRKEIILNIDEDEKHGTCVSTQTGHTAQPNRSQSDQICVHQLRHLSQVK